MASSRRWPPGAKDVRECSEEPFNTLDHAVETIQLVDDRRPLERIVETDSSRPAAHAHAGHPVPRVVLLDDHLKNLVRKRAKRHVEEMVVVTDETRRVVTWRVAT